MYAKGVCKNCYLSSYHKIKKDQGRGGEDKRDD
jgi:hypothetical protein